MTPIERLTPTDLINVYVETPSAPARVGALAILDGTIPLAHLRTHLVERVAVIPRLRQKIHRPGPLAGRPIWVGDPAFDIDSHLTRVELPTGARLTELAVRVVNQPFDHDHPLWRLAYVPDLPGGRSAVIFGMHHVVADGLTAVGLFADLTGDRVISDPGTPHPVPTWSALVRDNFARRVAALRAVRWPQVSQWWQLAGLRHAARTSLNRPVGAHRRLEALRLDLAAVKAAAHQHGGKVNDVVLALAAGGLRALLRARSEPVDGVRLTATVAMALRQAGPDIGGRNRTGVYGVRVPLLSDAHERLREIARESAGAKQRQLPTAGNGLLILLSRTGALRWFSRHQRMVHFVESNIAGPPLPLRLLGVPISDVVPVGTVVGNITVGFQALSYAGRLTIAVQADAEQYPDFGVLLAGMRQDAQNLGLGPIGAATTSVTAWG
jgi:diacylglycerol O-acyltransferase / wax synthase